MNIKKYINEKNCFDKTTWIAVLFGTFFASGIFGFIYETIFYIINNGALTRRGTCFGPWINIYGFGGIIIFLICYWIRKKPWLVFVLSGAVCGVLEYIAGYAMFEATGKRSWDYNTEIWNFGNIGGFICLRSIIVFALAGLLLIYIIIPLLFATYKRFGKKIFCILMFSIGGAFLADIIYNDMLSPMIGTIDAITFYGRSGIYKIVTGYFS